MHLFYNFTKVDSINNIEIFNTSKVVNMIEMFRYTVKYSPVFKLNLGNKVDTSNVTNMAGVFNYAGYKSSLFKFDCSNWDVLNVTAHNDFNTGVTSKVISPIWK